VRLFYSTDDAFNGRPPEETIHGANPPVAPPAKPSLPAIYIQDDPDFRNDYLAQYNWNTVSQTWILKIQTRKYAFTATGDEHTFVDSVGVPPIGEFIAVSLPSIEFAP